ncbi:xanthine dehydrogenase [Aplysia californica]|uniref:Xanthine dehydrogenase n=1 Tax=Aplysia californica TaxID=6500 RepID=A0ABM1VZA4_APLCA|nr:xanthine dehydrogenase [Aplysia californica]
MESITKADVQGSMSLTVNGVVYKVSRDEFPPSTTLLQFLRESGVSTGTKGCCYRGGCGVCVVAIALASPEDDGVKHRSVNACCMLLYACEGAEVTTVEGLGSVSTGLHSIQDRLAQHDGAQCGYCTPGQVMNMYGLLKQNPRPSAKQVEDAFDTTICRCTGYRPILDAMKSFAVDTPGDVLDIEELTAKTCPSSGQACRGQCRVDRGVMTYQNGVDASLSWLSPQSLDDLLSVLAKSAKTNYRLVVGNTGFGVYEELGAWNYQTLVDIRGIKELYIVDVSPASHVTLGANLTIADLIAKLDGDLSDLAYADTFRRHLKLVASNTIRNVGSWAGNIMVKHAYPNFASDVFTLLETVEARLNIVSHKAREQVSLSEFMTSDMVGKVIVSVQLPKYPEQTRQIRSLRTSQRLQACEASVVSGFNFPVKDDGTCLLVAQPIIALQLKGNPLIRCKKSEQFLTGKALSDAAVFKEAVKILSEEVVSGAKVSDNQDFLTSLAVSHFYKFVLSACKTRLPDQLVSGGSDLERDVMSGTQDLGTQNPENFPASSAVMKLTAPSLVTGEIKFLDDLSPYRGQLFAVPVLSTVARAEIASMDASSAQGIPGVVAFLQASDIPGVNNWRPKGWYGPGEVQELLCSGQVLYAGQPLGVVVADNEVTARQASSQVKVTYKNIEPAVTDLKVAIAKQRFHTEPRTFSAGDVKAALASAANVVSGRVHTGDQYHFHLENQVAVCSLEDTGGMKVKASSQFLDFTQGSVAQVLGMTDSDVTVEVTRLGGGFGGKMYYSSQVAGLCALAAHKTKAPTKMTLDLNTNMQMQGSRTAYRFDYEVAFDDCGKLLAVDLTCYSDSGAVFLPIDANEALEWFVDNCYLCPNWSVKAFSCHTDRPPSTACRAPGSAQAIFAMESIIDHVASFLGLEHLAVRKLNLFSEGEKTMKGVVLESCLIRDVVSQMEEEMAYAERQRAVQEFNARHRWKKRGLHLMPSMYSMVCCEMLCLNTTVSICHGDGSVVVTHGGVDMGQGINTKVVQVCALKLGVPVEKIRVSPSSTVSSPNGWFTGASVTSELVCMGVIKCCEELTERIQPIRDCLGDSTEWDALVRQCFFEMVDLTAYYRSGAGNRSVKNYSCYSVCCAEVELDVLTGQYQVLQVDYLCDSGVSLNPRLDLGQLEGGFMLGCGFFLLESMTFEPDSGRALSTGTWTYKPPMAKDLPIKFNAKFLRNSPNPVGVLGSKAVGETPVASGACPLFALKRAVEAARSDVGMTEWFPMDAPATVQRVHAVCSTPLRHMSLCADDTVKAEK